MLEGGKVPGSSGGGDASCYQQNSLYYWVEDTDSGPGRGGSRVLIHFPVIFNEASSSPLFHSFLFGSWIISWDVTGFP